MAILYTIITICNFTTCNFTICNFNNINPEEYLSDEMALLAVRHDSADGTD